MLADLSMAGGEKTRLLESVVEGADDSAVAWESVLETCFCNGYVPAAEAAEAATAGTLEAVSVATRAGGGALTGRKDIVGMYGVGGQDETRGE